MRNGLKDGLQVAQDNGAVGTVTGFVLEQVIDNAPLLDVLQLIEDRLSHLQPQRRRRGADVDPGVGPPSSAYRTPACAATPSPCRGCSSGGSAVQRRAFGSYASTAGIVPPAASPPTSTTRPATVAAEHPPCAVGSGGRVDHRPVRGSSASAVRRFVSNPAVRPAST